MKRTRMLWLAAVVAVGACHDTPSAPQYTGSPQFSNHVSYTLVDLGTYTETNATAVDINDAGAVVGHAGSPQPLAFLWKQTTGFQDLGTLGGPNAQALGVNDASHVVGQAQYMTSTPPHAFLWTAQDGMIDLTPGEPLVSGATAINNRGAAAGTIGSLALVNHQARAFIWTRQDGLTELGYLPGGDGTISRAINDRNQIVGEALMKTGTGPYEIHAYMWSPQDGIQDLGYTGPLPSPTGAFAINNKGHVAGNRIVPPNTNPRGFRWSREMGMVELHPAGALASFPLAVNDHDEVVGRYVTPGSPPRAHAFYWSERTGFVTLPELANQNTSAFAINNAGDIAGASGSHAVTWTRH